MKKNLKICLFSALTLLTQLVFTADAPLSFEEIHAGPHLASFREALDRTIVIDTENPEDLSKIPEGKVKIGTHNGAFHADEVLACALLKMRPEYREAVIIRSRKMEVLEACDIVIDVGRIFDPETLRFDHHKGTKKSSGEDLGHQVFREGVTETPLSSAGMIFKYFGIKLLTNLYPDAEAPYFHMNIYRKFVESIDAGDNGVKIADAEFKFQLKSTLARRIGSLNPTSEQDPSRQFKLAMLLSGSEFLTTLHKTVTTVPASRAKLELALAKRDEYDPNGQILVLDSFFSWQNVFFDWEDLNPTEERILFAIFQDSRSGHYRVQGVPQDANNRRARAFLPEAWKGYQHDAQDSPEKKALETLVPKDCTFCNGWIGGSKTLEEALAMAKAAIAEIKPAP